MRNQIERGLMTKEATLKDVSKLSVKGETSAASVRHINTKGAAKRKYHPIR